MNSTGEGNPFLIQAPPGLLPANVPDETPAEPADADGAPFITLPPGIALPPEVADSVTHRLAAAPRQARSQSEIVFRPAPIGVPVAPSAPIDPPAAALPAGPGPTGWSLNLGSGIDVVVANAAFVGRNPAATSDFSAAQLVSVTDPAKSVSKTHALFEVDDGVLYVQDLDSTNGTFVTPVDAPEICAEPGSRIAVLPGSTVELGDFPIKVTRVEVVLGT